MPRKMVVQYLFTATTYVYVYTCAHPSNSSGRAEAPADSNTCRGVSNTEARVPGQQALNCCFLWLFPLRFPVVLNSVLGYFYTHYIFDSLHIS